MIVVEPILKIEAHPFFVGPLLPGKKSDLPTTLPFYLGVHPRYSIPVLIMNNTIRAALDKAYAYGSMASTPLGDSELANVRMFETLDKLLSLYNNNVKNVRFLEIGCGKGALLNQLKLRGGIVTGLEIGPQGQVAAKKYGFKVIDKPLMPGLLKEKFDCILSYGCLEHIEDLDSLFQASREALTEDGLYFHSVPNNEPYFKRGGIDLLSHEHINYFNAQNGVRLFNTQGFVSAKAWPTKAGNELMLWGFFKSSAKISWPGDDKNILAAEIEQVKSYRDKVLSKLNNILKAVKSMQTAGRSIGFYAGGFEYAVMLEQNYDIRYFDGDSFKHGKSWLGGFPLIEPPDNLRVTPVDHLIIFKPHYFENIKSFLLNEIKISRNIRIHNIESLMVEK